MQTCLVCDDHAMMRTALEGAVALAWPDATISTAPDFPSGWSKAAEQPELILCDLVMPGADPVSGIRKLREVSPESHVLVITGSEDDRLLLDLFDLGIAGFVPKTAGGQIIEAAINLVLAGGQYIPSRIIEIARQRPSGAPQARQDEKSYDVSRLTERQIEVLRYMSRGESNKEIARSLSLSPATIKAHAAAIIGILGVTNRTEAAFKARKIGLL
jgi:two-component system, NarL family, nitrate/nitrite response regulator NarL